MPFVQPGLRGSSVREKRARVARGRADPVFRAHPLGRHADPDAVDAVLAGFSGFLVAHSRMPPPPGLPTLRAFQAALGAASVEWLRRRIS
jgi:hypothetical protein